MDQPPEEDREQRARSKRGAVMIFIIGWLFIPVLAISLNALEPPWFQVACFAMLAFIAAMIVAMVRVVKNF